MESGFAYSYFMHWVSNSASETWGKTGDWAVKTWYSWNSAMQCAPVVVGKGSQQILPLHNTGAFLGVRKYTHSLYICSSKTPTLETRPQILSLTARIHNPRIWRPPFMHGMLQWINCSKFSALGHWVSTIWPFSGLPKTHSSWS